MDNKALLLIFDGMGDRPVPELEGKTPLEASESPNLDRASAMGINGIMDPIAPGVRPGSDTSHLAYLGFDPYEFYPGRGPIEAAGIGLDVQPGDVAFRCNFATVGEEDMVVKDRRAGRIEQGTEELAKELNGLEIEGVEVIFKESVAHRGALILRGEGLGADVTDIDPHQTDEHIHRAEGGDPESEKTARILNKLVEISHEKFPEVDINQDREEKGLLPANIILARGAGKLKEVPNFEGKYGIKGGVIAEVGLIYGVASVAGLDLVHVSKSTGGLDTDTVAMADAALDGLSDHDFIMMNIKGCDLTGHDGDAAGKIDMIERIDEAVQYILSEIDEGTYTVFTADHSTPVSIMDHSGDPVPVTIIGNGVRVDWVKEYGERSCSRGGLGRIRGMDLMNILLDLMNKSEKFGA